MVSSGLALRKKLIVTIISLIAIYIVDLVSLNS